PEGSMTRYAVLRRCSIANRLAPLRAPATVYAGMSSEPAGRPSPIPPAQPELESQSPSPERQGQTKLPSQPNHLPRKRRAPRKQAPPPPNPLEPGSFARRIPDRMPYTAWPQSPLLCSPRAQSAEIYPEAKRRPAPAWRSASPLERIPPPSTRAPATPSPAVDVRSRPSNAE